MNKKVNPDTHINLTTLDQYSHFLYRNSAYNVLLLVMVRCEIYEKQNC